MVNPDRSCCSLRYTSCLVRGFGLTDGCGLGLRDRTWQPRRAGDRCKSGGVQIPLAAERRVEGNPRRSFFGLRCHLANDSVYIRQRDFERTIAIPSMGIRTTQFDLTSQEKTLLLRSGQEAAIRFFKVWDLESYNRKWGSLEPS